jgi:hypothetical protein
MLTFIQNALQAILDDYTGTTTLTKVSVVTIKSEERTLKDYADAVTLLLVYRDLPSLLPQLPVEDRVQDGTFAVFARADEKEAVQDILNEFINTYNATQQTSIDGIMYFTNAVPFGNSDNVGAVKYSMWQFGVKFRTLQSIYSLYDREIQINSSNSFAQSWVASNATYWNAQAASNRATSVFTYEEGFEPEEPAEDAEDYAIGFAIRVTILTNPVSYEYYVCAVTYTSMNATDGIVSQSFTIQNEYSRLPYNGGYDMILTQSKGVLRFEFLDSVLTKAALFKGYGYANTNTEIYINVVSGAKECVILARLTDFNDTANAQGFPIISMMYEGRLV